MYNASKLKVQEAKDTETYITAIGKFDPKWFIDLAQIQLKDLQVFAIIKLAENEREKTEENLRQSWRVRTERQNFYYDREL